MIQLGVTNHEVVKSGSEDVLTSDLLAVEEPLQIIIGHGAIDDRNQTEFAVVMRTPGHDLELTAGLLFSEGIIKEMRDIVHLDHCESRDNNGNVVRVELAPNMKFQPGKFDRQLKSYSGCGICGKTSIEDVIKKVPTYNQPKMTIRKELICSMPELIEANQVNFSYTGGMHAAALFDTDGNMVSCREDIGRHNAVDKIVGASLFNRALPIVGRVLFLSGRAGFELIQKSLMAGVQLAVSIGAPTSLAVEMAKTNGLTLLGFLKKDKYNIYTRSDNTTILK